MIIITHTRHTSQNAVPISVAFLLSSVTAKLRLRNTTARRCARIRCHDPLTRKDFLTRHRARRATSSVKRQRPQPPHHQSFSRGAAHHPPQCPSRLVGLPSPSVPQPFLAR
ncbi:hypothetical protein TRVL_04661 [Trypanosoma vivax]|nr:hypothetical protein TRVL_04661 [Trypanosoma vivax]